MASSRMRVFDRFNEFFEFSNLEAGEEGGGVFGGPVRARSSQEQQQQPPKNEKPREVDVDLTDPVNRFFYQQDEIVPEERMSSLEQYHRALALSHEQPGSSSKLMSAVVRENRSNGICSTPPEPKPELPIEAPFTWKAFLEQECASADEEAPVLRTWLEQKGFDWNDVEDEDEDHLLMWNSIAKTWVWIKQHHCK